jgi:transposase
MHSKSAPRRRHSDERKAQVLAACDEAGASVAAVARAHNLNANLVHKWRRGRGAGAASPVTVADIRVHLKRGATAVVVSWPTSAAAQCGAWLHEWLR